MGRTIFSDDPETPLNIKIAEIYDKMDRAISGENDLEFLKELVKEICREIYDLGFNEGEGYVWKMRSMIFIDDPEKPGERKAVFPGDPDYPEVKGMIVATSG